MGKENLNISFEQIRKKLQTQNYPKLSSKGLKISSVVMPFYLTPENKIGILLTKRSEHLKSHAGQISFPGGKYDEADKTILETALREWEEETGANRDSLDVLGSFHSLNTGTGYHITPFIAIYSGDFKFNPNLNEVEYLLFLELDDLLKIPFYTIHLDNHPSGRIEIFYFDLPQGLLWGATCHILVQFLKEFCEFNRLPELVKMNLNTPPFFSPRKKT